MTAPRTMFEKIWQRHVVVDRPDGYTLLYVDRHLMHDGSSPAYTRLKARGMGLRRADRAAATPDHYVKTDSRTKDVPDPDHRRLLNDITTNCNEAGVTLFDLGDARQGIIHVVGPEQGLSQPGITLVCGDSHTSTHGALGALAFGIELVGSDARDGNAVPVAAQAPGRCASPSTARLSPHITGKDAVILAIIGRIGTAGAVGHVMEYAGSAIRGLSMEGRFTLCNMSIEAGGRAGMVAPDEITFNYLKGKPFAPKGENWDKAMAFWKTVPTDEGATFDREVTLNAAEIAPMVTWGTSPEDVLSINGRVPDPASAPDAGKQENMKRALEYMDLKPGAPMDSIAASTACSSAPAPTAASRTCARPRPSPRAARPRSRRGSLPAPA